MADGSSFDLGADVVELAPFVPNPQPAAPLREVAFRANAWTPEEYDLLRAMFAADADVRDIATAIGRPYQAVRTKICDLGLRRNSKRPWSEWEEAEIVNRYGDDPTSDIARDIGRSCASVYQRAAVLGMTEAGEPPYTEWEDAQVRAGYDAGVPVAQIAALIGRTLSSVTTRVNKVLKVKHASAPPGWSQAECARALELVYSGARYRDVRAQLEAEGFPPRSQQAFKQMVRNMGYGRGWGRMWMAEEEEMLRRAYRDGASLRKLATDLGRTWQSLSWKAGALGIKGTHAAGSVGFRQGPDWTEEDDAFLRANYASMRAKEIAERLGRPKGGVYNRAYELGLDSGYSRPVTEDELRAVQIAYVVGLGFTDLAIATGRDSATVHRLAKGMGLKFSDPSRPKVSKRPRKSRPPPPSLAEILAMPAEIPPGPFLPMLAGWRKRGRPPGQPKETADVA